MEARCSRQSASAGEKRLFHAACEASVAVLGCALATVSAVQARHAPRFQAQFAAGS